MPLLIMQKLGLKKPKLTNVSLQLADRSITHPRGIVEDVLVKVDKFIFPFDFIVLDMEEDYDVPLILGPRWRNHPNFSYKNQTQGPTTFGFQAPQEKKSDLEDLKRATLPKMKKN